MPTLAEFRRAAQRVSNWGRWGERDQLGTLNLITPDKVAESAAIVRTGQAISLSIPFDRTGVWSAGALRHNPWHTMTVDGGDADDDRWERLARFNDDYVTMPLQAATHWDAPSHVYYDGLLYNGFEASRVSSAGATVNGIEHASRFGLTTRGVLVDVARHVGRDAIDRSSHVEPETLDAALDSQGVELRPGDILMVRTGWWGQYDPAGDVAEWRGGSPGLSWRCAEWIHERQLAAVAADNMAVEASNFEGSEVRLPLHLLCLRDMGLIFGELWDLEGLAAACAADGSYECQLVAAPIRFTHAVGAPVNPIAIR